MTNAEKAEFERQKRNAEKQLNEMYFGSNKGKSQGLKMPDFLSPAKGAGSEKDGKNAGPPRCDNSKPQPAKENPAKPPQKSNTGINLLNMLNLKNLTLDSDRLTVLALCLLLSSEEVDELLLLALVYIML